jgi:Alw26I/Eco31I/Esp3I family type II restriction m6 adenine DNA methyltransferase
LPDNNGEDNLSLRGGTTKQSPEEQHTLSTTDLTKLHKRASALTILDPACGSGSFLLGAYQFLLDWYHRFYTETDPTYWEKQKKIELINSPSPEKGRAGVGLVSDTTNSEEHHTFAPKDYRLTLAERKRILLTHIHGVDIDSQAVEVAKLNLLLKASEGGNTQAQQQAIYDRSQRLLPDLEKNIVCGNSLVEWDITKMMKLTREDEERIKPFDFKQAFPDIMKAGGFDVVIGNPPYDVLEKDRGSSSWPHDLFHVYSRERENLKPALGGKLNLFRFFVIRSIEQLKERGRFGNIIPLSILGDISTAITRKHVFDQLKVVQADCFPQKDNASRRIFKDAKLSTVILTGEKNAKPSSRIEVNTYPWNSFEDTPRSAVLKYEDCGVLDPENLPIPLVEREQWDLLLKLHKQPGVVRLGTVRSFQINRGEINQTILREFITTNKSHSRLLKGVEINQFGFNSTLQQGHREFFNEKAYLKENSPRALKNVRRIATQRITGVDERLRIVAMIIDPPTYFADSTNSIAITDTKYSFEYLLALLNSTLYQWRFKLTSTNNNVGTNELESLPFHLLENEESQRIAAQLAELVSQIIEARRKLEESETPRNKSKYSYLHTEIDRLVYELHGLSEEEIRIVEGAD